jgi:hypothetical protein
MIEGGKWDRLKFTTEANIAKAKAADFAKLAKMTPEGRAKWVKDNGGSDEEAQAYGSMSPNELLAKARATKIPYEIKSLQSKVALDDTRAKQIVEATRFIGPSFDIKRDKLALDVANVNSLVTSRAAGIQIRQAQLKAGVASMNNARTTASKVLNTATIEMGRIMKTPDEDRTYEQNQRIGELQSAINANTDIITGLNQAAGFIPGMNGPNLSLKNFMFGDNSGGGTEVTFPDVPIGGGNTVKNPASPSRPPDPTSTVKPKKGFKITNIKIYN